MRLTARADYALRAAAELAAREGGAKPVKAEELARAQDIPARYLEAILGRLRAAGLVGSQRGADGGYWLARPATSITLAQVIRAVQGPLADIRGQRPEGVAYRGSAEALRGVWIALRASERAILESVTLADVAAGQLPPHVAALLGDPEAWQAH